MSLNEADWQSLRECAHIEGMQALVLAHATEARLLPALPTDVADVLLVAYARHWIWNRRLRGEHRRVVSALADHGVDVILMKGVTLAERLYGEIAHRPIGDIDLLVRPEDLEACGRILSASGYAPLPGRAKPSQWHALVNRALAYRHEARFALDVHWALTSQPSYVASFPLTEIWQAAESAQVAGRPVKRLSAADELRFLCYHYAAQHEDKRLIWLVDIAEILRTLPASWDWGQFVADTVARNLAMPVHRAFATAREAFDLALPAEPLAALAAAAVSPREQLAWRAARANRWGARAMYAHLKAQEGIRGRFTFGWQGLLWHAVLPARERLMALRRALPAL